MKVLILVACTTSLLVHCDCFLISFCDLKGLLVPINRSTESKESTLLQLSKADNIAGSSQNGVQKDVIKEGSGPLVEAGQSLSISYRATLADPPYWSPNEVVDVWLSTLQGMDGMENLFIENNIDSSVLVGDDSSLFAEALGKFGLSKIQQKKLEMAARRLAQSRQDTKVGELVDEASGYVFVLGEGKLIRGMESGLLTMKVGERSRFTIRSDWAYGAEGLRKRNGDVLVPPYAALAFEVSITEVKG